MSIPAEKAVTSAAAILPPTELCTQIEAVRSKHDKAFERWPPHINLLFPFIPEASMEAAVSLAEKALAAVGPFSITFNELSHFDHGKNGVILIARPTPSRPGAIHDVQAALERAFPWCNDQGAKSSDGFTPHLTLGQFDSVAAAQQFAKDLNWKPITFNCDKISFIARSDETKQRFVVRQLVSLPKEPVGFGLKGDKVGATFHDLGDLGRLVTINVPTADALREGGIEVSKKKPLVVAIVDRSGSMGSWVTHTINTSLPNSLLSLGYPPTARVVVITFDSISERVKSPVDPTRDPTIEELSRVPAACRGSTSMASAVIILSDVLKEYSEEAVSVVVVSDGAIDDKAVTVQRAEAAANSLKGRSAPISVSLLQMLTSSYAEPDTRAMSCIGSLNTAGKVSITEVHTSASKSSLTSDAAIAGITEVMAATLGTSASETVPIASVSSQQVLHRLPGDAAVAQLSVTVGRSVTILLEPNTDLSQITCAGRALDVTDLGPLRDEYSVGSFLQFVESQLRVWAVMGARKEDSNSVLAWLQKLQNVVAPVTEEFASVKVTDRAHQLLARIEQRKKSFLSRILQLGNLDKLSQLNSKQQADFLRGATGAAGVAVAKRAAKVDADMDFDELCRDAIRKLAEAPETVSSGSDTDVSFYSRDTFADIIACARELAPQVDDLTAIDILPLVGGIGVPFRAYGGAYPDPWAFSVIEVYPSVLLSESDLRSAVLQGGVGEQGLQCPGLGRDAPITGVMPLSLIDPPCYQVYARGALRALAELQASVSIRKMVARVPYDFLARDAAVLVSLCQQIGPTGTIPEFVNRVITDVSATVAAAVNSYAKGVFADLVADLATEDPRPFLSGDKNISGVLKPYTAMLCIKDVHTHLRTPLQCGRILRALYAFDAYIAAKRQFRDGGRDEALSELLGFDLSKTRVPLLPLFEVDPEPDFDKLASSAFNLDEAATRADALAWVPSPDSILAVLRFALSGDALEGDLAAFFGVRDLKFLKLAAAALAISQPNESDRIDTATRKALCPDIDNTELVQSHLCSMIKGVYQRDYQARVAAKKTEEARIALARLVALLTSTADMKEFITKLQGINSRSSPGYLDLETALLDMAKEVPERLAKLDVILICRDKEGNPIWANGNVRMLKLLPFEDVYKHLDPSGERWAAFIAMKLKFGLYRYRETKDLNRHGHGNSKPSFWALGYQTLDAMRLAVSPEEFQTYRTLHYNCCHNPRDTPAPPPKQ